MNSCSSDHHHYHQSKKLKCSHLINVDVLSNILAFASFNDAKKLLFASHQVFAIALDRIQRDTRYIKIQTKNDVFDLFEVIFQGFHVECVIDEGKVYLPCHDAAIPDTRVRGEHDPPYQKENIKKADFPEYIYTIDYEFSNANTMEDTIFADDNVDPEESIVWISNTIILINPLLASLITDKINIALPLKNAVVIQPGVYNLRQLLDQSTLLRPSKCWNYQEVSIDAIDIDDRGGGICIKVVFNHFAHLP